MQFKTRSKVLIELHSLKGDVVETAEDNMTAAEPLSKQPSSTFGVPIKGEGKSQKFSFLGAAGISSELPESGVLVQGGTAYVPESAITLQAEGAAPQGLPEGSGPLVAYTFQVDAWGIADAIRSGDEAPGREAALEREAAEEAEGGGDPCKKTEVSGDVYIDGPNGEEHAAKAWATLHWCWNEAKREVSNAYWVPGSLRAQTYAILDESARLDLDKWTYKSNFIRGRHREGYRAIVSAVFSISTLPSGVEDAVVEKWFIHTQVTLSLQVRIWDDGIASENSWHNSCVYIVGWCI
jgi:hypothetical protein